MEKDQVREYLNRLDIHKSMSSDGMHSWVLRELMQFLIAFEREILEDWKKANVPLVFKKEKKQDLGNDRLINLKSVSVEVVEHIFLETTARHLKDIWE